MLRATEEGSYVDSGAILQRRRQEERRTPAERRRAGTAKQNKGKQVRLNYNEIANPEYGLIRRKDWYTEDRRDNDLTDRSFWCAEQEYIYKDVYATLSKPIRPMATIDLTHLSKQQYFADAYNVLDQMGLLHLMTVQCDYNTHFILQFYSTVVFTSDENMKIKWMTGLQYCESTWARFAELLGYEIGAGRRLHGVGADHNKSKLADLYGPQCDLGSTTGLLPLYAKLVRLLRDSLVPSGGNNDAIRTSLVELLSLAQECHEEATPDTDYSIDVMDFIFHEMRDAMLARGTVPYAPYIMLLIKDALPDIDFSDDCDVKHKEKKPYKIKANETEVPYPAPSSTGGFMRDARTSGPRSRTKKTSTPNIGKEIKKLSWYEKYILCRSVDDHKEAYQGYVERHEILQQNAEILHHVTGNKGAKPKRTKPKAYKDWNSSRINYIDLERHLSLPTDESPPPPESETDEDEGEHGSDQDLSDDDAEDSEEAYEST